MAVLHTSESSFPKSALVLRSLEVCNAIIVCMFLQYVVSEAFSAEVAGNEALSSILVRGEFADSVFCLTCHCTDMLDIAQVNITTAVFF